jgi:hypothetical protein
MREQDGEDLGVWSEFGSAAGLRAADAGDGGEGGGDARTGLGNRPDLDGLPAVTGLGNAPTAAAALGDVARLAGAKAGEMAAPRGYRNRVDADGDGDLDKATYRGRADGGADILVDLNKDGRTDFIGHDVDLDNRVDYADYDKDHDGVFEKRMYDDDGDGYLDRTVWTPDS